MPMYNSSKDAAEQSKQEVEKVFRWWYVAWLWKISWFHNWWFHNWWFHNWEFHTMTMANDVDVLCWVCSINVHLWCCAMMHDGDGVHEGDSAWIWWVASWGDHWNGWGEMIPEQGPQAMIPEKWRGGCYGPRNSRLPMWLAGETTPSFSICSINRAARLYPICNWRCK